MMKHAEIVIKVSNIVLPRKNRGVKSFFEDFARKNGESSTFINGVANNMGICAMNVIVASRNTEPVSL